MSFGNKRLDDAYDNWATQTPEDANCMDEELKDEDFVDLSKIKIRRNEK